MDYPSYECLASTVKMHGFDDDIKGTGSIDIYFPPYGPKDRGYQGKFGRMLDLLSEAYRSNVHGLTTLASAVCWTQGRLVCGPSQINTTKV